MFDPVTMTRSTSAELPAPEPVGPAPALAAVVWPATPACVDGGGELPPPGACANALERIKTGSPTASARATRTDPNGLSTFLIISFSMGLVRFGVGNSEESNC